MLLLEQVEEYTKWSLPVGSSENTVILFMWLRRQFDWFLTETTLWNNKRNVQPK
jgi:hypothetical protein